MKKFIKPFATGIVMVLFMVVVMLKITVDFQILLIGGTILFLLAGMVNARVDIHYLVSTTLIVIFSLVLFSTTVLVQIPELWYFVPIYFVSCLIGISYKRSNWIVGASIFILSIIVALISNKKIPDDLKDSLTEERFDPFPEVIIHSISGDSIPSKSLKGKVLVLDFFGTWCKPCIQELKELEKIQDATQEDYEIEFYVINADQGGDTPQRFKTFIYKNNYDFNFAYDYKGKILKELNMYHFGVPVLLIIDKEQNIRFQHVGFNTAETGFVKDIIEVISTLK